MQLVRLPFISQPGFLSNENKAALWLSLLLFCVVIQFASELVRGLYSYPYQWHALRVSIITLMATFSGIFLNLLVSHKFGYPRRIIWGFVAAQITLLFYTIRYHGQDEATYFILMLGVAASILQTAFAVYQKKKMPGFCWLPLCCFRSVSR